MPKAKNPLPETLTSWPARRLYTLWTQAHMPYALEASVQVGPYTLDLAHPASKVGISITCEEFHQTPTLRAEDQARLTYLKGLIHISVAFL